MIAKPIRDSVVFAAQNLIDDPPLSKLDLVSCRNVLIYLEPEVQQKLISLFHFALNPGAYLFLGSAEGVGTLDDLFAPISKARRIFRRVGPAARPPLGVLRVDERFSLRQCSTLAPSREKIFC